MPRDCETNGAALDATPTLLRLPRSSGHPNRAGPHAMLPAGPIRALRVERAERRQQRQLADRSLCPISSTPTDEGAFVSAQLSDFARSLMVETAFTVLGMARTLKAAGKDVVELEIGDSPFDSTAAAPRGRHGRDQEQPVALLPVARASRSSARPPPSSCAPSSTSRPRPTNIVVGPGAKVFEQFFCEAFLNPGDGVLVFSPYFPTYVPNIERRGARAVLAPLASSERVSARHRRHRAVSRRGRLAARDLPQLAAQPDRRRRRRSKTCAASPISCAARDVADLQRRALLPHGLEGQAPLVAEPARHARAVGRRVHVQQVVQHERLAARLRGGLGRDRRRDRQDDQHDAVVHAADRAARGHGRARSAIARSATTRC